VRRSTQKTCKNCSQHKKRRPDRDKKKKGTEREGTAATAEQTRWTAADQLHTQPPIQRQLNGDRTPATTAAPDFRSATVGTAGVAAAPSSAICGPTGSLLPPPPLSAWNKSIRAIACIIDRLTTRTKKETWLLPPGPSTANSWSGMDLRQYSQLQVPKIKGPPRWAVQLPD
jgi:hypothetical protein